MFIFLWILCGIVAGMIGNKKGEGFLLPFVIGAIFGPFGIVFVLISKGNKKNCPFCKELMHKEATRCPHCQEEIPQNSDQK